MSIPRVIHYCWFGRGEKSALMKQCMESWKKYCPDWEIIEWNEDNYDVNFCPYTAKAYREKRWGFLPDAARLDIVYRYGGVYLDTDVELLRPLDELLENEAWFGYGTNTEINLGSGFGADKGHWLLKELLEQYLTWDENRKFTVCTTTDSRVFARELPGFAADHDVRQEIRGVLILNNNWHYAIHHYTGTWQTPIQRVFNQTRLIKKVYFSVKTRLRK